VIDKAICHQQLGKCKEMPALSKQHHYMMLTAAVSLLLMQLFQSLNTNDFGELKAIVRAEYYNIAFQSSATYSLQLISVGYFTLTFSLLFCTGTSSNKFCNVNY